MRDLKNINLILCLVLLFVFCTTESIRSNVEKSAKKQKTGEIVKRKIVDLSLREKEWIKRHKIIKLGVDPQFRPFEFIGNDGSYYGMAADIISILKKRLNINMVVIPNLTWNVAVESAKIRNIDVLPCVGLTEERKKYFIYSDPYLVFPRVIITLAKAPFIGYIDDLKDKRVAVQRNSSHHGYIKDFTKIDPVLYPTALEALESVSDNINYAAIGNLAVTTFLISKNNLSNLKIASHIPGSPNTLHFAVRKDWPELVSIINKGLATITPDEHQKIRRKWVTVKYVKGMDWNAVFKWGVVLLIVFLTVIVWNRVLAREISKRKKLVEELQTALDHVKTLSGLLPICANCKKIRDDKGYWNQIEAFIQNHSRAVFSHGICPDCAKNLYNYEIEKKD